MFAARPQLCSTMALSSAQLGIWFAQKLDPTNPIYNIGQYTEIRGAVSPLVFEAAIRQVISETDALRLRFFEHTEGPRQVITELPGWSLPVIDLTREPDPDASAQAWMRADLNKPVSFNEGCFFTFALIAVEANRFFWYQRYHHIINDGYGTALIAQRVADIYTAITSGRRPSERPFGSLVSSLRDDDDYRASDRYRRDRQYWLQRFADKPEPATLAGRHAKTPRDAVRHSMRLESEGTEKLRSVAQSTGGSWQQVVTAAMAVYLHRMTGVRDLVVGLTVTTRVGPAAKSVPCTLSGVVPLRVAAHPGMHFSEMVRQVAVETRQGLRHQRYRSEDFQRDLGLLGQDRRLFGPIVNIMSFDYDLPFGAHRSVTHGLANGPVDDLSLIVYERSDFGGLRMDFIGNPDVYSVDDLGEHLRRLSILVTGIADPSQPIGNLDILAPQERSQILADWNGTSVPVPAMTLPALFEDQAARTPSAIALVFRDTQISYQELNARSNSLARILADKGVGPEDIVALIARRSVEMAVGLLGILKSGAAYMPLDPDYPVQRLTFMAADARPSLVLAGSQIPEIAPSVWGNIDHINLDSIEAQYVPGSKDNSQRIRPLDIQHAAYVIYTSGSTGAPKGVVNTHGAIVNRLLWMQSTYQLEGDDRVLQKTPFGFDISLWEFFAPWACGGALVMAEPGGHRDPAYLVALIQSEQITTVHFVPSMLQAFLQEPGATSCRKLRRVVCSGEALSAELEAHFHAILDVPLHNFYGPTEAAIEVSAWDCPREGTAGPVPIGHPIWNTRLYILDANLRPQPLSVPGELYIAGIPVARGYLHRPELTAERFLADPHGLPGGRMYRTGDLTSWRINPVSSDRAAVIDYLGRTDRQVKIRGFRIELGEIENAMLGHPSIAEAAVVVCEGGSGDKRVVGYFVPARAAGADSDGANHADATNGAGSTPSLDNAPILEYLSRMLPDYMVPAT
ncbi:MAG TPA: amino acid adenylation domain-containing protein, partial [Blastocatellia bacterium]|nr:amino acid adenylation domain-containing protein [Blastocatellia bacterium]